ncbi:MAG: iron-containing alcohol dehydrogenase [Planctomycetaceae bacterium]
MNYTLLTPARIVFGWGRRTELPSLLPAGSRRAFVLSGSRTLERLGMVDGVEGSLSEAGVFVQRFTASAREPEVGDVDQLTAELRAQQPGAGDVVVAIGGGSAIDLAKAVAALATNHHGETVTDFLEGVGRGLKIEQPPLPLIVLPTTAGTGTEATKNAVISSYDPMFKKSLRSDLMVPQCVLVDPELTISLPATITASTGMDAITQLIESYISKRAAPIPQALCEQGLELALPAISRAVSDPADRSAREAMSHAALLSGMALANSGLGVAHGVAAALGVHCRVAHGLACAVMLPAALRVNRSVRQAELARLARRTLAGHWSSDESAAQALIERIEALCREVGIPSRLRDLGVQPEQIPELVVGSHGNSLSGNPRDLNDSELTEMLEELW